VSLDFSEWWKREGCGPGIVGQSYGRSQAQAAWSARDAEVAALKAENDRLRKIVPEVLEKLNDELCDENAALRAECERLRVDAERAVGLTASRCREMAMWPQGIDDEQAFYGQMFAEFITKEFGAAIDAALREEQKR